MNAKPKCETCDDTGLYFTGAFVGDPESDDMRAVYTRCPDCKARPTPTEAPAAKEET